jgi:subtilisin family serine protease/subtilisin-like proprotein convertase family protein
MKPGEAKKSVRGLGQVRIGLTGASPLWAARALGLLAVGAAVSAGAGSASAAEDGYFIAGGKKYSLRSSGEWVGVRVTPNASGVVAKGVGSEAAVDASRQLVRFAERNLLLVPVKGRASAQQKSALRQRLANSSRVQEVSKLYQFGGESGLPFIDTGNLVVRFSAGTPAKKIEKTLASFGATVVRPVAGNASTGLIVRVGAGGNAVAVANLLSRQEGVEFAHPDFLIPMESRAVSNDPLYPEQWHLKNTGQGEGMAGADVKADQAWDITKGSPNVTIAIMDDGVDIDHEDFGAGKIVPGFDAVLGTNNPRPKVAGTNGDNHGTACAGVATAAGDNGLGGTGLAPGCKLMAVRVLADFVTPSQQASAFYFAARNGADVISNSWGPIRSGVPLPDVVKTSIDFATTSGRGGKGAVVLFASGNSYRSMDTDGYAAYERVIAVGASNNFDRHINYSNFGRSLDVVAPSGGYRFEDGGTRNIITTDRMGDEGYVPGNYTQNFNGTSSSTPLVAGLVGLLLSVEPNLTSAEVRERLISTADKIDVAGGAYNAEGQSIKYGYGRVNAYRALLGRRAQVTLLSPADNATVSGSVPLRARTLNDARVEQIIFEQRRLLTSFDRVNVNKAIPDYNFDGLLDTQLVSPPSGVPAATPPRLVRAGGQLSVRINHTYMGDLQVVLVSPDGRRETVYNHANGDRNSLDLNITLPVVDRPIWGAYTLQVIDDVQEDNGVLVSWGLRLGTEWTNIATVPKANHRVGTDWTATWNAAASLRGRYEVRATAVTDTQGSLSDTNTNINNPNGASEATYVISGFVRNATRQPVVGALVTDVSTGATTRTNASGAYSLPNALPGRHVLRVSMPRTVFTPSERIVTVTTASLTNIDFVLSGTDASLPTLAVVTPQPNSFHRSLAAIRGTASDASGTELGSGISRVTGVLYRFANPATATPAGYYNRSRLWQTLPDPAQTELTASGTTNWALAMPTTLSEGRYMVTMRAYDKANNVKQAVPVIFTIDRTSPIVRIVRPAANTVTPVGSVSSATGTATDAGGLSTVTALFYRFASGRVPAGYWNGRAWTTTATASNEIPVAGTSSWEFRLPIGLGAGRYALRISATDRAGNISRVTSIFTLTAPSPTPRPTTAVAAQSAPSPLSTGSASTSGATLVFTSQVPSNPGGFAVAVNNVEVQAESVSAVGTRVTIGFAPGSVRLGDAVTVTWPSLSDSQGRFLPAGSRTFVAR